MFKFSARYSNPADPAQFDEYYMGSHVPNALKIPGVIRAEVFHPTATPGGKQAYLVGAIYFADEDNLQRAMASPEMQVLNEARAKFAVADATVEYGEVFDPLSGE